MSAMLPETATFREFADIVPCRPSWVTALRKDDRLVLTEDGKRVRVRESLQRIEDTRDDTRAAVAARHAEARVAKTKTSAPETNLREQGGGEGAQAQAEEPAPSSRDSSTFQHWRERGERAKALAAERENAIAEGKLMDATAVVDQVKSIIATLRTGLESLPDFLAIQLVGIKEESKARALIATAIEEKLAELSRQFGAIAKEHA
jgi:hypothetical protein